MRSRRKGREGQVKGKRKKEQGMVLLAAVVMMSGLIFVATTSSLNSIGQTKVTSVGLEETRTFYAAEAAVEWGTNELRTILENNLDPEQDELDVLSRPTLEGYNLETYQIEKSGTTTSEVITSGDYIGLYGYVQRYNIEARVSSERRSTGIVREIQHQYIPLFQFGVFYDKDLEIFPGKTMTFGGRVHTNANLYMGSESGAGIDCDSYVTAVGQYWHHRKDGSRSDPGGYVRIKDAHGVYQDVWRGSYWLDNRQAAWASEALEVWEGQFRDEAHGLAELRLPLPPAADQHIIVERPDVSDGPTELDQKYWYKATVRYLDGVLTDSLGNVLSQPGIYTYTENKFYDDRENKWIDVVDINISRMITDGFVPPNRIIYVSSASGDAPAVRIKNGGTLPNGGLTIATDLPMYVWGHYNNVSKKGSALLCDAITLLSPNWLDANSFSGLGSRTPSTMNINCCVMTGHVPTPDGGTYSGGFENLFRFLENWSTQFVNFRGSVIDLWDSRLATTTWSYGIYYNAPKRNWGFDTDLLQPGNWPPGTPRVHTVQRGAWRQIS